MKDIEVDPVAPTIDKTFASDVTLIARMYENNRIPDVIKMNLGPSNVTTGG